MNNKLITRFYVILNCLRIPKYIGLTTRTLKQRFREHIKQKHLVDCTIEEIAYIEHENIDSLEKFIEERHKAGELEKRLIKKYKNAGYDLMNLSDGGEWGSQIYHRIMKEDFFKKYGTYEGFQEEYNNQKEIFNWFQNWVKDKSVNPVERWFYHWVIHKSEDPVKRWFQNWVKDKSEDPVKLWFRHWIKGKSEDPVKIWFISWNQYKSGNPVKIWFKHWAQNKSGNPVKLWFNNWVYHKSEEPVKLWFNNWVYNKK